MGVGCILPCGKQESIPCWEETPVPWVSQGKEGKREEREEREEGDWKSLLPALPTAAEAKLGVNLLWRLPRSHPEPTPCRQADGRAWACTWRHPASPSPWDPGKSHAGAPKSDVRTPPPPASTGSGALHVPGHSPQCKYLSQHGPEHQVSKPLGEDLSGFAKCEALWRMRRHHKEGDLPEAEVQMAWWHGESREEVPGWGISRAEAVLTARASCRIRGEEEGNHSSTVPPGSMLGMTEREGRNGCKEHKWRKNRFV